MKFHKAGFWFLIIFLAGILAGGFLMFQYNKWQIKNSVEIGAFVHEYKSEDCLKNSCRDIYDLKKRL